MTVPAPVGRAVPACLLTVAFFLDTMGSTSVFAAGPAMESSIGLSQAGLQWTFTAATLPAGALLLTGGRLADLHGRRRMFRLGLSILVLASLACGLANGAVGLISARAAQGVAGALLMPAALSLLLELFPADRERARALAAWSAVGGAGATAGLLLGGLVTQGLGWSWVFWINVPIGVGILALSATLPRAAGPNGTARGLDPVGTIAVSTGIGCLLYAVSEAPARDWFSVATIATFLAGVVLVGAFVRVESRARHPMIPPRLLRLATVLRGSLVLLVAGMCADGLLFCLTLYTQRQLGFSAMRFGLISAVMTVASVATAYVAERAIAVVGADRIMRLGLGLLCLTCACFAVTARYGGSTVPLAAGMLLFGAGMGCAYVAGSITALEAVPEADSGIAAGLQNIAFTLGSTLGVAVLSTVSAAVSVAAGSVAAGPVAGTARSVASADRTGLPAGFATGAAIAALGLAALGLAALAVRRRSSARQSSGRLSGVGSR
jgi:EmrB/QacA subfamily drug resistance transporter